MGRYVCIHGFELPKYDEHEELIEGEFVEVTEGSVWESEGNPSLSYIRLEKDGVWMEISAETLGVNFKKA